MAHKSESRIPHLARTQLCGIEADHCISLSDAQSRDVKLQPMVVDAFQQMEKAAAQDGLSLAVASGFRDFSRQEGIWNRKVTSRFAEESDLSPRARLDSILRWSALPGLSRHHWGTDLDVYDPVSLGNDKLLLEPWEYRPGGHQAKLFTWLERHAHLFGFYRPYQNEHGQGVAPEPWHWSFAPLAVRYQEALLADDALPSFLQTEYQRRNLAGHTLITAELGALIQRYIGEVSPPSNAALSYVQNITTHQGTKL
ncbi:M15 family metallopeptidase [Aliidiomarina sanyensis]|uniref:Peptidase M15 n=1 Tax=Aliidiomarina sanyensis TaxID=1249555 RepID=A0A432WN11_9GAMM|nr:M15 family metallopeptidase [Aliidiomarina sanyensis]RUO35190.1 peptidase M15 [Aliidiomarina sanyensis]